MQCLRAKSELCVGGWEKERDFVCVCVCARMCVCVHMCVCEVNLKFQAQCLKLCMAKQ